MDKIIDLIHPNSHEITFQSMKMQKQNGSSECGVFAIAVATALCFGEDLSAGIKI